MAVVSLTILPKQFEKVELLKIIELVMRTKRGEVAKRIENKMAEEWRIHMVPSFFIECLAFNCPDAVFAKLTWTSRCRAMLFLTGISFKVMNRTLSAGPK
ncbi:MAG: hypothetical protein ACNYPI_05605 [Arenicellales bacterium WSBS_2016_MAG_OTU3]